MPCHPVHLILDAVKDVRVLEAEEEGKAECFAHRPAASSEEVNQGDHELLVSVVSLRGPVNLRQKVVNIASKGNVRIRLAVSMVKP